MKPLDSTGDAANEFSCDSSGSALHGKAFKIPESLQSDQYTVQLSWTNSGGTFYSCADVKVDRREDESSKSGFCRECR